MALSDLLWCQLYSLSDNVNELTDGEVLEGCVSWVSLASRLFTHRRYQIFLLIDRWNISFISFLANYLASLLS